MAVLPSPCILFPWVPVLLAQSFIFSPFFYPALLIAQNLHTLRAPFVVVRVLPFGDGVRAFRKLLSHHKGHCDGRAAFSWRILTVERTDAAEVPVARATVHDALPARDVRAAAVARAARRRVGHQRVPAGARANFDPFRTGPFRFSIWATFTVLLGGVGGGLARVAL